jgi:DNA-binding Lrp family transcriptional regulator
VITALVSVYVDPSRITAVAEEIAGLEGVSRVYSVMGEVDLVALCAVPQHEDLAVLVPDTISRIEGVLDTRTSIAYRTFSQADLDVAFDLGND